MEFQTVRGTQENKPLSFECCGNVVFVRKNINSIVVETEDGSINMWEYEEAKVTVKEFTEIFAANTSDQQETQQAQIDYIAMMSDIELEV